MIDEQKIERMFKKADVINSALGSKKPMNLAFSGGKDSIVLKYFADKFNVNYEANFNNTGIESYKPMINFIRTNYPDVTINTPPREKSFFIEMKRQGIVPSVFKRWCCNTLKHGSLVTKSYNVTLTGIRSEESHKRRERGAITLNSVRKKKREKMLNNINLFIESQETTIECIGQGTERLVVNPIFDLTEQEVWEIIHKNNLPYPEVYDSGANRIGCLFCPFQRKDNNYDNIKTNPNVAKAWLYFLKNYKEHQTIEMDFIESFFHYVERNYTSTENLIEKSKLYNTSDLFGTSPKTEFIDYLIKYKVLDENLNIIGYKNNQW